MPAVTPDAAGRDALHAYLGSFLDTYGHYGVVIRAWMENQVSDRKVDRLGVDAFTHIAEAFAVRLHEAGAPDDDATRRAPHGHARAHQLRHDEPDLGVDRATALDTLTTVIHRGFFSRLPLRQPASGSRRATCADAGNARRLLVPSNNVAADENQPPVPLTHAIFASGTCRSPASPRSCFTASTMRNMPRIPGWQRRQPAAVGVGGQRAADAELAVLDERAALAEPQNPSASSDISTIEVNAS